MYLLDGSTLSPEPSAELLKAFPAASNQHGKSHWPVVLMVVAHDLVNGLAVQPSWGPMYGPHAVSELQLALKVVAGLPEDCMVIADRYHGVFRMLWELQPRRFLIRMTDQRAQALLSGVSLSENLDRQLVWKASPAERRKYPEIPEYACVQGRLVVQKVAGPSGKPVRVCLFTTDLSSSAQELAQMYTKRWNIETDLRSLKQTVGLEILRSKTPDMLAKEFVMAVAAYNLVRVFMALAARRNNLQPRRMSFTRAANAIRIYATREPTRPNALDDMLDSIAARPLPLRKERPHPPRKVWRKPTRYPARKEAL